MGDRSTLAVALNAMVIIRIITIEFASGHRLRSACPIAELPNAVTREARRLEGCAYDERGSAVSDIRGPLQKLSPSARREGRHQLLLKSTPYLAAVSPMRINRYAS